MIYLDKPQARDLRRRAFDQRQSVSALIREAVAEYLRKIGKPEP